MKKISKFREKINIGIAQSPRKAVLVGIMLLNVAFVIVSALVLSILSNRISGLAGSSFWVVIYRAAAMVIDPGGIDNVLTDVGQAGVLVTIVCLIIVIFGMIFFTGAVIGYIGNAISDFIESKNNGKNKLLISDHIVIINWNTRALEIINEYLYEKKELKAVVLVSENKDEIDEEIQNRINTSLLKEEQKLREASENMSFLQKRLYIREHRFANKLTCIVREGDVAAATDLDDICISEAKTVIILDNAGDEREKGNAQTIKTLIQVSEISKGNGKQSILVEVLDDWTEELVNRVISYNLEEKREFIVPILYDGLLGAAYSHIAINPAISDDDLYEDLFKARACISDKRNLIILGHNSNMDALMEGLNLYSDKLSIVVLDDKASLEEHDNYSKYPYVETFAAGVYDDEAINDEVFGQYQKVLDDTTILILSDDSVDMADVDADALTYLIYVQEGISRCKKETPNFSRDKLAVVVEVQNPKNEEIVLSYGADRVIVCNRYVSHIISQLSLK